jgi:hypothetical protein
VIADELRYFLAIADRFGIGDETDPIGRHLLAAVAECLKSGEHALGTCLSLLLAAREAQAVGPAADCLAADPELTRVIADWAAGVPGEGGGL